MADEDIRTDEEPEVEAHGAATGGDKVEGQPPQAQDDDDSDDVEAHGFTPTGGNADEGQLEGNVEL